MNQPFEPPIVAYGREFVGEYAVNEFEEALKRAFVQKRADFIFLDSNPRGQKFLSACAAWAIDRGLLTHDVTIDDSQSQVSKFRLTESGKEFLFLDA